MIIPNITPFGAITMTISNQVTATFWARREDRTTSQGKKMIQLHGSKYASKKEADYVKEQGKRLPYIKAIVWETDSLYAEVDKLTANLPESVLVSVTAGNFELETYLSKDGEPRSNLLLKFIEEVTVVPPKGDKEASIAQEAQNAAMDAPPFDVLSNF